MSVYTTFLRPLKAKFSENIYQLYRANQHKLEFDVVSNAILMPPSSRDRWDCCVVQQDGTIHPYCIEDYEVIHTEPINDETASYPENIVLYAGYINPHWGHFLMDCLPQLWPLFQDEAIHVDKIIFLSDSDNWERYSLNIRMALELTGYGDKVDIISSPIKCRKVIVPRRAISPREYASPEASLAFDVIVKKH